MITGRGPGAPSVTPDMVFTLRPDARSEPGGRAFDLAALRRSEAVINLLGARRLLRPRAIHDPAVAALSVLASDVDSYDSAVPAPLARTCAVRAAAGAAAGPTEAQPGSAGTWVHVAAVVATIATVAGVAGSTGIAVAGVLGRIARLSGSIQKAPAGWGWRPPITGRPGPPRAPRPR